MLVEGLFFSFFFFFSLFLSLFPLLIKQAEEWGRGLVGKRVPVMLRVVSIVWRKKQSVVVVFPAWFGE